MRLIFSIFFILVFLSSLLHAQSWLYPETIVQYNPLRYHTADTSTSFLNHSHFWGEGGMYVIKRDDSHRWDATIGGTIELIGGNRWNVIYETNLHLVVDPNNNLTFNPRAFVWEEGILYGVKVNKDYWQFGYQHRCKHDVDNLEVLRVTGREEERSLIYGSLVARWERPEIPVGDFIFHPLAEAHIYLLVQDQRFPVNTRTIEPKLSALNSALRFHLTVSKGMSSTTNVGIMGDVRVSSFGPLPQGKRFSGIKHIQLDPAAEIFFDFIGSKARLRLFIRYVYQPDNFITPIPRSSSLIAVGVRILDRGY